MLSSDTNESQKIRPTTCNDCGGEPAIGRVYNSGLGLKPGDVVKQCKSCFVRRRLIGWEALPERVRKNIEAEEREKKANTSVSAPASQGSPASAAAPEGRRTTEQYRKRNSLNARQKAILDKRRQQQQVCEENWGGPCKGGCGEYITGQYVCPACKQKKEAEAFALQKGEIELYRAVVGEPEDKVVKQVVVTSAADGEIEDTEWIWFNKIPLGCATWVLGQPNNGKSLMTCAIAACVTTGKDFPDGSKNTIPPSKVLMYCGEDSIAKIVRPRLLAAGADLTKVDFLDRKSFRTIAGDSDPEKRPLDLSQDCDVLLELVKQHPDIKLLIVDPITGVFGNKNINKNEEANPVFEQLIDFCEASGIAFVAVLHVPKRTTNSSIEKIAGGTAVAGSAKSAFMLSRDPDSGDKHDHLLTMVKWNYASDASGIKYKTVPATASWKGKQTSTASIQWGEIVTEIADDVLVKQNSKKEARNTEQEKCDVWMLTYLGDAPKRSPEVYKAAESLGFSETTVKRSLQNIKGSHLDGRKFGRGAGWWMAAPGVGFDGLPEEKRITLAAADGL